MDYHNLYIKYKTKYINLKKKNMSKKTNSIELEGGSGLKNKLIEGFYFVHMTKDFPNLKGIITDGQIRLGSDIPEEQKFLSGYVDEPYVFANIYFDQLENLKWFGNYSLIFSSKIILDQDVEFIGGWGNSYITITHPSDNAKQLEKKLDLVKKFIAKPEGLPKIVLEAPPYHHHEVKFNKPIQIDKYLRAISINCPKSNFDKEQKKIKKLLKKNHLEKKIKIISGSLVPKSTELDMEL